MCSGGGRSRLSLREAARLGMKTSATIVSQGRTPATIVRDAKEARRNLIVLFTMRTPFSSACRASGSNKIWSLHEYEVQIHEVLPSFRSLTPNSTILPGTSSAGSSIAPKNCENNACGQEKNASNDQETIGIGQGKCDSAAPPGGDQKGGKEHSLWIEIIQKKICSNENKDQQDDECQNEDHDSSFRLTYSAANRLKLCCRFRAKSVRISH